MTRPNARTIRLTRDELFVLLACLSGERDRVARGSAYAQLLESVQTKASRALSSFPRNERSK